jgi:hypothetical protein
MYQERGKLHVFTPCSLRPAACYMGFLIPTSIRGSSDNNQPPPPSRSHYRRLQSTDSIMRFIPDPHGHSSQSVYSAVPVHHHKSKSSKSSVRDDTMHVCNVGDGDVGCFEGINRILAFITLY